MTNENIEKLAVLAVEETKMGNVPDKILKHKNKVLGVLKDVKGIAQVYLDDKDVVRHKLVRSILSAYKSMETE
jgi:phosphate starvation-inducible protein PhoH